MCATRSCLVAARSSAAVKVTEGSPRRERLAGGGSVSSTESDSELLLRKLVICLLAFKADMMMFSLIKRVLRGYDENKTRDTRPRAKPRN